MVMRTVGDVFAPKLPKAIQRARALVAQHPNLFLHGKASALAQVLVTYTNLERLQAPLIFNRGTPARLLAVSTRTIDRLLGQLESLGWLKRLPQPRLGPGTWGCTSISWAPWVIQDFFSPQEPGKASTASRNARLTAQPSHLADRATNSAHQSFSPKGEVFQKKASGTIEQNSPANKSVATGGRRIPADLVEPMTVFGLQPDQICILMARCKAMGVRLQAVLAACTQDLTSRSLKAKDAMAWLMYKIGLKIDFDYAARQEGQRKAKQVRTGRRQTWLKRMHQAIVVPGTVLPDGRKVLQDNGDIVTLCDDQGRILGAMPSLRLVEELCRRAPAWARAVARGRTLAKNQRSETGQERADDDVNDATRRDRAQGRATLAQIKAMLKPSGPHRALA
jgi:hypothetical protein